MHHSNVIFARFDNTTRHANEHAMNGDGNEDDGNSSVVEVDLHFGTDQSIENVNRAFNNPMFDATQEDVREGGDGCHSNDDECGIKEEKL